MQFHIFADRSGYTLTDGDNVMSGLASEGIAIELAITHAQDADVLYSISYWRP